MITRLPPLKLDLDGQLRNLRREGTPNRVFFFEHGEEPGTKESLCTRFDLCKGLNISSGEFLLQREIRLKQFLGQELMRVFPKGISWQGLPSSTTAVPPAIGPIQSWADFEAYPWPTMEQVDLSEVEWLERNLPENMGLWTLTYLFQQVSNLFGFAPLCMKLYEDRELIKAVTQKVGDFYVQLTEAFCQFSRVVAIGIGDDMGHKTATLISPDDIRQLFIPWHKCIIAKAHENGKLGLFHVCGQVEKIMDDLIDTVGIDARHSTQDVIEPIIVSKSRWGRRVTLLGGVDVDFITRARPEQVRSYTRTIIDVCVPGGGFALGVGNWVADSIPIENYLTMLGEARMISL